MSRIARLSLNGKLGLLALGLGALATAATVKHDRVATVHAKELLTRVERAEDHVTPAELATWIIEGRGDFRLIDIRDAAAFAAYHIPTAEHVPLAALADGALARSDKIVLYGDGGIHAAQGWMVLSGLGYRQVYSLLEGLDAWKEDVLYPLAPSAPSPTERAQFERTAQVARFFGGQPRAAVPAAAAADAAAPTAAPAAVAIPTTPPLPPTTHTPALTPSITPALTPALPTSPGAAPIQPKKKREGC